jgi:hypothetical protein
LALQYLWRDSKSTVSHKTITGVRIEHRALSKENEASGDVE